jgi:hypothetical protein
MLYLLYYDYVNYHVVSNNNVHKLCTINHQVYEIHRAGDDKSTKKVVFLIKNQYLCSSQITINI